MEFSQVSPWKNNNLHVNKVIDWMENLNYNDHNELSELSKGILTCWQVWQDQNNKVLNSIDPNAFRSASIASKVVNAYFLANNIPFMMRAPNQNNIIKWIPPSPNVVKLNFDGSASVGRGAAAFCFSAKS